VKEVNSCAEWYTSLVDYQDCSKDIAYYMTSGHAKEIKFLSCFILKENNDGTMYVVLFEFEMQMLREFVNGGFP
jgi:formylmethanofuran dehydrogenase subunit E-like metal-binding protein